MPLRELSARAATARLASRAGSEVARGFFRSPSLHVENKGERNYDPVTEADRAAERRMRDMIMRAHPGDCIEGEEYGVRAGDSGWTWYLDPVDGTRAFICGVPVWTGLVAVMRGSEIVFGCVAQPVLGEFYEGDGDSAWLDEGGGDRRPLTVSGCSELATARLSTTDPRLFGPQESACFGAVRDAVRLVRYGLDAYAYARLAAGDIDLVVEAGLRAHDLMALIPLVTGAGGVVSDWSGNAPGKGGRVVAAASQQLLEQALVYLARD